MSDDVWHRADDPAGSHRRAQARDEYVRGVQCDPLRRSHALPVPAAAERFSSTDHGISLFLGMDALRRSD